MSTLSRKGSGHVAVAEKIPDIRITDEVLKRMVREEQRRIGDPNVTKTCGRIIERYFAAMRPVDTGTLAGNPV